MHALVLRLIAYIGQLHELLLGLLHLLELSHVLLQLRLRQSKVLNISWRLILALNCYNHVFVNFKLINFFEIDFDAFEATTYLVYWLLAGVVAVVVDYVLLRVLLIK